MKSYRTIEDVLRSPWAELAPPAEAEIPVSDRVLRSTRLEDSIYADMRDGDDTLLQIEQTAGEKLRSFPALSRDVYQSFYAITPKKAEESGLSAAARKFNAPILEHITQSEDYPTLKATCEGRDLPAYEAATEFVSRTAEELDSLLSGLGGEKGAIGTLEKLEAKAERAQADLAALLERMRKTKERNETLERAVIDAANQAESKRRQVEAVSKLADTAAARSKAQVSACVTHAVQAAAQKAEEVQAVIGAWGDDPGSLERTEANAELLALVRKSDTLKDIWNFKKSSKMLCRQIYSSICQLGKSKNYAVAYVALDEGAADKDTVMLIAYALCPGGSGVAAAKDI